METGVVEQIIKVEKTTKDYLIRALFIALTIISFLSIFVVASWGLLICVIFGFLTYLAFQRTDLEYEYSFFDGEITVDKIMSKAKRKRLTEFDLKDCEGAGYEDSQRLGQISYGQVKVMDLTSHRKGNQERKFIIFLNRNGQHVRVETEFNEKMAKALQSKAPNKVWLN